MNAHNNPLDTMHEKLIEAQARVAQLTDEKHALLMQLTERQMEIAEKDGKIARLAQLLNGQ